MPSDLSPALRDLEARAREMPGFHPETSHSLHVDLYEYILDNHERGQGVIEIGCYKGASSLILAYACRERRAPFHTVDVHLPYLDFTRQLLETLGLREGASFFHGTTAQFVLAHKLAHAPLLVFVDGDHNYHAVLDDIRAIYRLNKRPYAIAFHDFSLRSYHYENIRVDLDVRDAFGANVRCLRIGSQFDGQPVPNRANPSASGSYWKASGTEGVIVELGAHENLEL